MKKKNSKVLILHTGGTFAMALDPQQQADRQDQAFLSSLATRVPELQEIAEIELEVICNIDSSDVDCTLWQKLATAIYERWDRFDGCVIIHGTDTMAYTASALSFFLAGLTKPVVLTGSQRPLAELRTDARANIIDAVELATSGHPEVMVCFDSVVYRGSQVTKRSSEHLHAFAAQHSAPLGHFGVHFNVNRSLMRPVVARAQRHKPSLDLKINPDIFVLDVIPAAPLTRETITVLTGCYKGFIVRGFGVGNLPLKNQCWLEFAEAATACGLPLVIASQCQTGTIDLNSYENGRALAQRGAMSGHNMSLECLSVKLMVMLGREIPFAQRHDFFETSLAGECGEVPV
ncbi:MAG: asparaginase [Proteobacteria bacterium]|nr:asparaginase [Pseudomonadota bacterium]